MQQARRPEVAFCAFKRRSNRFDQCLTMELESQTQKLNVVKILHLAICLTEQHQSKTESLKNLVEPSSTWPMTFGRAASTYVCSSDARSADNKR
jgi:hypothetical protein